MRPVRPADRDRIVEITNDVWEGRDYIPRVFDDWVADAGAEFQAAEIDDVVVGIQRLRPYAPGLIWYEGLRVASEHRRHGIARVMLGAAVEEARQHGFQEMRLATRDLPDVNLFESQGFTRLVEVKWWRGLRVEGGEPARMPDSSDARKLWSFVASSPGIPLYAGICPDMNGARDLTAEELARLADHGLLRVGPGGRAVALPRYLRGQVRREKVFMRTADDYAKRNLEIHFETWATDIDFEGKVVRTNRGQELRYDAILIATGGRPKPPPWPGAGEVTAC